MLDGLRGLLAALWVDHNTSAILVDGDEVRAVALNGVDNPLTGILHHHLHPVLAVGDDAHQISLIQLGLGHVADDDLHRFPEVVKGRLDGLVDLRFRLLCRV